MTQSNMAVADQEARRVNESFIAAINAHDVAAVTDLMTEDHRFVDATGAAHVGRERMRAAWQSYFAAFPEYRIDPETTLAVGGTVAVFGWASGPSWRIPAAWKAIVRNGLVFEWQVCCDVEPMLRSIGRDRPTSG